VACTGNNSLVKITPGGVSSVFASSGMNGPWFLARQPGLNVFVTLTAFASGPNVTLSWPTNAVGFQLQSATGLSPTPNWTIVTNIPTVAGSRFFVTNAAISAAQFFRLAR